VSGCRGSRLPTAWGEKGSGAAAEEGTHGSGVRVVETPSGVGIPSGTGSFPVLGCAGFTWLGKAASTGGGAWVCIHIHAF